MDAIANADNHIEVIVWHFHAKQDNPLDWGTPKQTDHGWIVLVLFRPVFLVFFFYIWFNISVIDCKRCSRYSAISAVIAVGEPVRPLPSINGCIALEGIAVVGVLNDKLLSQSLGLSWREGTKTGEIGFQLSCCLVENLFLSSILLTVNYVFNPLLCLTLNQRDWLLYHMVIP